MCIHTVCHYEESLHNIGRMVLAYLKSYLVNQQSTVVALVCNSTMGRYSRTVLEMSLIRAFRRQMLAYTVSSCLKKEPQMGKIIQ